MGGATYICTDKTGTLTSNQMTVVALYAAEDLFEIENLSQNQQFQNDVSTKLTLISYDEVDLLKLLTQCSICTSLGGISKSNNGFNG